MVVSKPCIHSDCPQRQGIIRGQYESVEIIREVQAAPSEEKSTSTTDLTKTSDDSSKSGATAVEWLMITRSDPGGSVPRFMIERGTPPGIVGDAGKFLKWISSPPSTEKTSSKEELTSEKKEAAELPGETSSSENNAPAPAVFVTSDDATTPREPVQHEDTQDSTYSSALYSMITGALGKASHLATGIARQFSSVEDDELADDTDGSSAKQDKSDALSDTSSIRSFASAVENDETTEAQQDKLANINGSTASDEGKSQSSAPSTQQEKELRKLQEKRRRLEEKMAKAQERLEQRLTDDKEKDASSQAKAREKHERELAKQEAKYRKELRKLEDRREQEIRKKEEKDRKTLDKREKATLSLELERTRFERDEALQKLKLLEKQVQELQNQNTSLVDRLGKLGISDDGKGKSTDALSAKSGKSS